MVVTRVQWDCPGSELKRRLTAPEKCWKRQMKSLLKPPSSPRWIINPKTYSRQPRQPRARIFFLLFSIQNRSYFHPGENFWLKPPPCRTPLFTIMLKNFNYENFKLFRHHYSGTGTATWAARALSQMNFTWKMETFHKRNLKLWLKLMSIHRQRGLYTWRCSFILKFPMPTWLVQLSSVGWTENKSGGDGAAQTFTIG